MDSAALELSLLDVLAYKAGCSVLSDLRYIDDSQRLALVCTLKKLSAEAVPLCQWNAALDYLAGAGPCPSAEQARTELIGRLSAAHP